MINHAWKRIADIVSNVCGIPRSVDDVRNKLKQEKCKIKKKAAKTRKEGGWTGRGPAQPPLKDWEEKLLQLIGTEAVSGIEGGLETSVTVMIAMTTTITINCIKWEDLKFRFSLWVVCGGRLRGWEHPVDCAVH